MLTIIVQDLTYNRIVNDPCATAKALEAALEHNTPFKFRVLHGLCLPYAHGDEIQVKLDEHNHIFPTGSTTPAAFASWLRTSCEQIPAGPTGMAIMLSEHIRTLFEQLDQSMTTVDRLDRFCEIEYHIDTLHNELITHPYQSLHGSSTRTASKLCEFKTYLLILLGFSDRQPADWKKYHTHCQHALFHLPRGI